jgi:hypothetical protein
MSGVAMQLKAWAKEQSSLQVSNTATHSQQTNTMCCCVWAGKGREAAAVLPWSPHLHLCPILCLSPLVVPPQLTRQVLSLCSLAARPARLPLTPPPPPVLADTPSLRPSCSDIHTSLRS